MRPALAFLIAVATALGAAGCELIRSHYGWDAAAGVLWENLRHLPAATGAVEGASSTDKRSTYARADSA